MYTKTKTYKYLYIPMMHIYFSDDTVKALKRMNVLNAYIGVETCDYTKKKLHLLVEVDGAFLDDIDKLTKSSFYVNHYSVDKNHVIITMHMFGGKSYDMFLESRYSEMYSHEMLANMRKSKKLLINDRDFQVLTKDDSLKQDILKLFYDENDSNKIDINELDSKLNIEDETFLVSKLS